MHDAHASLPAGLLVGTDVFHGIDDDALALATAAEQVRGTDRRRMEELAKDHVALTCVSASRRCPLLQDDQKPDQGTSGIRWRASCQAIHHDGPNVRDPF